MGRSLLLVLLTIASLLAVSSPGRTEVAIYASPAGDVGWCAGYDVADDARTCARAECESVADEECSLLVLCTNGGWGAVAMEADTGALGAACGRRDREGTRAVAVAECARTASAFCEITDTFKDFGPVATKAENEDFLTRYYHQMLLWEVGYYDGTIDAEWGPKSHAALLRYQSEHGDSLSATGEPDNSSFLALLGDVGERRFNSALFDLAEEAITEHPDGSGSIAATRTPLLASTRPQGQRAVPARLAVPTDPSPDQLAPTDEDRRVSIGRKSGR